LQQVFWNLLRNAVKFTPTGGAVQVALARENSHLDVSVIDNGEGIDSAFLPQVFDRFRQADGSTTRRHGGLGLGLAIVRQLVELHGGTVRASSPGLGQGSTFVVSLPVAAVPLASPKLHQGRRSADRLPLPAARSSADIAGIRMLVVDDEADARSFL